jgi:membrane associated rhomboid family serine protease
MFNSYPRAAFRSLIFIQFFSGIMIWLLAPTGIAHIGASGVIYGWLPFSFSSGFFRKDRNSMAISLLVGRYTEAL